MLITGFVLGCLLTWAWMSGAVEAALRLLTGRWLTPEERVNRMPAEQWLLNTEARPPSSWRLLGYWADAQSYPQACLDLAGLLADRACLCAGERILDVEFSSADQLQFWADYYQPAQLLGLSSQADRRQEVQQQLGHYPQLKISSGRPEQLDLIAAAASLDKIIALDCAYRFHNKAQFFARARTALKHDGALVLSDMLLARTPDERWDRRALKLLPRLIGLQPEGLWQQADYQRALEQAGFVQIEFLDCTEEVFSGFCYWLAQHRRQLRSVTAPQAWLRVMRLEAFIKSMMARGLLRYQVILARPAGPQ